MVYYGNDPDMRRIVQLSRNVDREFTLSREHWTARAADPTAVTVKVCASREEACCDQPMPLYHEQEHQEVCTNCGFVKPLGFEECGRVVQIEQRIATEAGHAKVPYSRLKHFKKILRDVTRSNMRLPRKVIDLVRADLDGAVPNRFNVRAVLRAKKLYHYYTSENYIASCLGDDTIMKLYLRGSEVRAVMQDVMRYSFGFDLMKARKTTKRRNFVNAYVLLQYVVSKLLRRDITTLLRMPSEKILKQSRKLLQEIEAVMLFEPSIVTRRAQMLA